MMHEVASHGGGMAAASSVHINLFGPHPIVVHGTRRRRSGAGSRAWSRGEDQCCFGFTEPDAGLNTTAHQDLRREGPGRLPRARPEGLDLDRAGRQQDHAADPHHAARGLPPARPTASRSSTPTSTAPKIEVRRIPKMGRKAVDFERHLHRRPVRARGRPHRRGGQGLRLHPAQPQPRARADRRRGDRHRPGRAAPRGRATRASASCSTGRSARTRASSIRWRSDGCISRRRDLMAHEGGRPLRRRPAVRGGGQQRQVPRRARRLRRLPAGGADPWRLRLRQGVPRRAAAARSHPSRASRRSPSS